MSYVETLYVETLLAHMTDTAILLSRRHNIMYVYSYRGSDCLSELGDHATDQISVESVNRIEVQHMK